MTISIYRLRGTGPDLECWEGFSLDGMGGPVRVLSFSGPAGIEQRLREDVLALAARRGMRLAEGMQVRRDRGRVKVSAVVLDEHGQPLALPDGDHWRPTHPERMIKHA